MSVQLFNSHNILMEKGKKLDNKEVLITFEKLESKKLDGGQQKDATHPTMNGTFIKCYQQNG